MMIRVLISEYANKVNMNKEFKRLLE